MSQADFEAQQKAAREDDVAFKPKRGVQESPELRRIQALPRRQWETAITSEIVEAISAHLRAPGGKQTLRPVQAAALCDIHDYGGMFGSMGVGLGKTLVSLLAAQVLQSDPQKTPRVLLLVPAKLQTKTRREMNSYREHWRFPGYIRVLSYELLGRPQSADLLEQFKPEIIIGDECHRTKNTSAAVTKRLKRWMEAHPETRLVMMSGTITKRSLLDYAHIANWCLKGLNPTPRDFSTRLEWSLVLDEKPRIDNSGQNQKLAPGALEQFCNDEERALYVEDPVKAVRRAYRRRLTDTPGVVATQENALGTSLSIDSVVIAIPEAIDAVKRMRQSWIRPDGEEIVDAMEFYRHIRELSCGMWYRWNPSPPQEWMTRRRMWTKAVREVLKNNRQGIDSESLVMRAVKEGKLPHHVETLRAWLEIQQTFTPKTEALWVSTAVLDFCAEWMAKDIDEGGGGIVWVEHVEFGKQLSQRTGVPFYQRGGVDQRGKPIEDHPTRQHKDGRLIGLPLIASIASNSEGRNMQAWCTNLIVSCPSSGATLEQLLGRSHRPGQEADEVSATIVIALREQAEAFERARKDAIYIADTTGQPQKLTYADVTVIESSQAPLLPDGNVPKQAA